jgi:hypothetical protein
MARIISLDRADPWQPHYQPGFDAAKARRARIKEQARIDFAANIT